MGLMVRALASVATHTEAAPARTSAWAAARAVAPVVKMSSIDQDVLHVDGSRIGDREGAAHIQAPLAESEAGLALGGAQAHQGAGSQGQPPIRMGLAQKIRARGRPGTGPD